jgi:hypothetical protein
LSSSFANQVKPSWPKTPCPEAGFRPEIELFDSGDIVLMQGLLKDGALEGPLLVRNGYRSGRLQQRHRTLPTVGANADDGALARRHGRQLLHGLTQMRAPVEAAFPLAALAQSAEIRSTPCSLLSGIFRKCRLSR